MADTTPSSAPMFESVEDRYASLFEDQDVNAITMARGANQFLGHQAAKHDDQSTVGPRGNRVQSGQVPRTSGPSVGSPSRANPLGANSATSLNG